jgi:serine/threonine protein kinase
MTEIDHQYVAAGAGAALDEGREASRDGAQGTPSEPRAAPPSQPPSPPAKSQVLNRAYEEFCRRRAAGEELDPDEFCRQFPAHRSSVRHRLALACWLEDNQDLIPEETTVAWPEPGETFGDYTLLRELGRGAFARVFLATEGETGDRPVVLKVSLDASAEARTLGRLTHENIVPVFSAGRHETGLSLVCMPFLGSATLHDVLDRAYARPDAPPRHGRVLLDAARALAQPGDPPLKPGEPAAQLARGSWNDAVAYLGERLASALAALHADGVRHRDLKPSNVLLDPAGRPLLLDFNLSDDDRLNDRRAGGTLPYMAPEQLRFCLEPEGGGNPDDRADLFGLGVILYELLTGRHPFGWAPAKLPARAQADALLARQRAGCVPVRRLNPRADRRLAALVERCLAFDAKDRPASAAELAEALRRRLARPRLVRFLGWILGGLLGVGCAAGVAYPYFAPVAPAPEQTAPPQGTLVPLSADEEYREGCRLFDAGRPREADDHFVRALKLNRTHAASWFARGRTLLERNDFANAGAMFVEAAQHRQWRGYVASVLRGGRILPALAAEYSDDGEVSAARAYCFLLKKNDDPAYLYSSKAKRAGVTSIQALNNHALACMRVNKPKDAKAALDEALAIEGEYLPARYNRAIFLFERWQAAGGPVEGNLLPVEARDDIDVVVARHGDVATVHVHAASIYAALADASQPEFIAEVRKHLIVAVSLGSNKERLKRDRLFQTRLSVPALTAMLEGLAPGPNKADPDPVHLRAENPIQGWLGE